MGKAGGLENTETEVLNSTENRTDTKKQEFLLIKEFESFRHIENSTQHEVSKDKIFGAVTDAQKL